MNTIANGKSIQEFAAMRRNMGLTKEEVVADCLEDFSDSAFSADEIAAAAEDGFHRED